MTDTNGTLMKEADIGNIFTFWAIDLENNPELYNLICLIHLHTAISKFYNLVFVEAKSCNIKISPRGKKKAYGLPAFWDYLNKSKILK